MFFLWHSRIGDRNEIRAQKTGRKTGKEKKYELRRKEKCMVLKHCLVQHFFLNMNKLVWLKTLSLNI